MILAALLALAVAAPVSPAPAERLYVFAFVNEDVDAKVVSVLERAVVEAADDAGFDAISHDEVTTLLDVEAAKQVAGCSAADSCIAELAGSLGVARVVSGRVTRLGATTILALTLTDAKSARVVARETIEATKSTELRAQTPAAVRRLLGIVDAPFPTMLVVGSSVAAVGAVAVVAGVVPYVGAQLALGDALAADDAAAAGTAHDAYEDARGHWNSWGIVTASIGAVALVGGVVVAAVGATE